MKKQKEKTILLTREEARDLLKITFPTLRKWTNEGLLVAYQLGGKIYYKRHEILEALAPVN
jgi:excisionase family DNA binding protein